MMDQSDHLEIDLGKYIEILFRQWRLIIGAVLVCALAAAVVMIRTPVSYQARVLIPTTKIASSVTFGSTIETLSEGQLPVTLVDRKARLQSYVALVSNPLIAERVYEELKGDFGDKLPAPESLIRMVNAAVLTGSDAIEIKVSNGDPALSTAVANAWGRHYVDYVNNLYASGTYQDTLLNVQRQANDAHANYLDAQQAYIAFLSASSIDEFSHLRDDLRRVERLLVDAQGLQEQVVAGGDGAAASNALAVSLLKTQVFASNLNININTDKGQSQVSPPTLQFQANPIAVSSQDLIADLNSLVTTLENRRQAIWEWTDSLVLQDDSQTISASVEATSPQTTASMNSPVRLQAAGEEKIRQLTSLVEYEEGRKKDLALTRDVAWDAYQNLAKKEAELVVASQTGGQEVVLGSTAVVVRNGSSLVRDVGLAALVGLVLGVFLAFFIEFWWGYKGREPQAIFGWNFGGRVGKDT
jgi:capsular polysaccharide biosynthesis protein